MKLTEVWLSFDDGHAELLHGDEAERWRLAASTQGLLAGICSPDITPPFAWVVSPPPRRCQNCNRGEEHIGQCPCGPDCLLLIIMAEVVERNRKR